MACIAVVANAQFSQTPVKTFNDYGRSKVFNYKNGDQIFFRDNGNPGQFDIYDLSFALKKTIDLSTILGFSGLGYLRIYEGQEQKGDAFIYLSETIFNEDNLLEFIVGTNDGFAIVNENYEEIFRKSYTDGWNCNNFFLLKTKNGNLLEVSLHKYWEEGESWYSADMSEVYALSGYSFSSLRSTSIQQLNNPYPNPAKIFIHLPYTLPQDVKEGAIRVFNSQGQMIKTFSVDGASEYVRLETSNLPAGNYFYTLDARGQKSDGKQFIVSK